MLLARRGEISSILIYVDDNDRTIRYNSSDVTLTRRFSARTREKTGDEIIGKPNGRGRERRKEVVARDIRNTRLVVQKKGTKCIVRIRGSARSFPMHSATAGG